jgi:hypothetical protein
VAVDESTGDFYVTREANPNIEVFAPRGTFTPPPEFELKIDKTGAGSGTVISTPAGITCGVECSAEFVEGEIIELEAEAEEGSEFAGWSAVTGDPGTCVGTTSPCEVTMSEAVELEAEFAIAPPTVANVSPNEGPLGGGQVVTLTGTNLSSPTGVEFGGTSGTEVQELSSTELTVKSPAHAAGTVDVTVTTAGGTSATSSADEYTFVTAPTVTNVEPTTGPTAGGTVVTITGTELTGATKVEYGGTAVSCTGSVSTCKVESATEIKATTAGHSAGAVHVIVTTPGGPSAGTLADEFTYVAPPAVTAVNPTHGPTTGGNQIEITGLRLSEATKVEFGTAVVNAPFAEDTATTIKLNAPAHAVGTVDVRVTTLGGVSGKFPADNYTYGVPSHTLTVSHAGNGLGTVTCNGGACASSYTEGTSVTLAASAASGSSFAGFSGGGCSGTGSCTVTLNANVAVTATFNLNPPPPPPPPAQCVVPKLKGKSLGKAKEALSKAHCKTGKVTKPKNKKGPLVVKSSTPSAGTSLPDSSKVNLKLGPKPTKKGKK